MLRLLCIHFLRADKSSIKETKAKEKYSYFILISSEKNDLLAKPYLQTFRASLEDIISIFLKMWWKIWSLHRLCFPELDDKIWMFRMNYTGRETGNKSFISRTVPLVGLWRYYCPVLHIWWDTCISYHVRSKCCVSIQ